MTIILIFLSFSFLLGGCWDRVEVNDLAIVTAAAIDAKGEDQIELSVQVFIPKALGGGGTFAGGGGEVTLVRKAHGVNISDALSKLQMEIPRRIFWGHAKTYIFGEEMAKRGISDIMDFLTRHPQPRERAYMFVSKGKAQNLLRLIPPLERYSGEVARELSDLNIGMSVTMIDLKLMMRGETGTASLPVLDILEPLPGEKKEETIPYIYGSAIFKKDKMVGQVTERATRGMMWLTDKMSFATVTIKPEKVKGYVSLNPIRQTTKLIPKIEDGTWKMTVKVKTEGDIIENGTNLNLMNPKLLDMVQEALRDDIENRIQLALKQVQKGMKADVFGFGREYHRKYPQEWKKVKDRWEEVFPTVKVAVDVEAYIRRPGLITSPGGIPESEVKKK